MVALSPRTNKPKKKKESFLAFLRGPKSERQEKVYFKPNLIHRTTTKQNQNRLLKFGKKKNRNQAKSFFVCVVLCQNFLPFSFSFFPLEKKSKMADKLRMGDKKKKSDKRGPDYTDNFVSFEPVESGESWFGRLVDGWLSSGSQSKSRTRFPSAPMVIFSLTPKISSCFSFFFCILFFSIFFGRWKKRLNQVKIQKFLIFGNHSGCLTTRLLFAMSVRFFFIFLFYFYMK